MPRLSAEPQTKRVLRTGMVVPNRPKWHGQIAAFSLFALGRTFASTWRIRWDDQGGALTGRDKSPLIFCLWHNRLAVCMAVWQRVSRGERPAEGLTALVSASKDGALLARTLEWFGVQPVRGSSSRRGSQALLEMTTWIENGWHAAITPDGPRGPRYKIQDGLVTLAQLTGAHILPVGIRIYQKRCLHSWDGFQVPMPFARCDVLFDRPIPVPRNCSDTERQSIRGHLQERMLLINPD